MLDNTESNFQSTALQYIHHLEQALEVEKIALSVIDDSNSGLSRKMAEDITASSAPLRRQLDRLKRNEFRIAVVGLEKAGKSSLINSWIGHELLPSKPERCTYTTTELHSISSKLEQELVIEFFDESEFEDHINSLEQIEQKSGEDAARAKADLQNIRMHESNLRSLIRKGNDTRKFTEIDEIKELLRNYVASEEYAYAVKKVTLHTHLLQIENGVIFYDVPGLNSGLQLHEDAAKMMLMDCDAIIMVQDASRPNLEGSEQKLLQFAREGDPQIPLKEKIFVFMNGVDKLGNQQQKESNMRSALHDWKNRIGLTENKLIIGSALAELLVNCKNLSDDTKNNYDKQKVINDFENIMGKKELSTHQGFSSTGISQLQKQVHDFLENDRIHLLKKRCEEGFKTIKKISNEILHEIGEKFGTNCEEVKATLQMEWTSEFQKWTDNYLNSISGEVNEVFNVVKEIKAEGSTPTSYGDKVINLFSSLPSLKPSNRDKIFDQYLEPDRSPEQANFVWREKLLNEVEDGIQELGNELGERIYANAVNLLKKMNELIWNDNDVDKKLIGDRRVYEKELKAGVKSLIMRYARPLTQALLFGPRKSTKRQEANDKWIRDLESLEHYNKGGDSDLPKLSHVANPDKMLDRAQIERLHHLISDPCLRPSETPKFSEDASKEFDKSETTSSDNKRSFLRGGKPKPSDARPNPVETTDNPSHIETESAFPSVYAEVIEDLLLITVYMRDAVYWASGVEEYQKQELRRLHIAFSQPENVTLWRAATINAFNKSNPKLLSSLPIKLRRPFDEKDIDLAIVDKTQSLREQMIGFIS